LLKEQVTQWLVRILISLVHVLLHLLDCWKEGCRDILTQFPCAPPSVGLLEGRLQRYPHSISFSLLSWFVHMDAPDKYHELVTFMASYYTNNVRGQRIMNFYEIIEKNPH
jgi:hypothetical protein